MPGPASAMAANCRFTAGSSGGSRGASGAAPAAVRSSAPCPPIAGNCSGEKMRSSSLTGPAAHESDGAAGALPKSRQRVAQCVRDENLARSGSEVENGPVDVEQDGELT